MTTVDSSNERAETAARLRKEEQDARNEHQGFIKAMERTIAACVIAAIALGILWATENDRIYRGIAPLARESTLYPAILAILAMGFGGAAVLAFGWAGINSTSGSLPPDQGSWRYKYFHYYPKDKYPLADYPLPPGFYDD